MDSRITQRVTRARKNFTETPAKRKNNKPETIFRDSLREIAPLYGCELIAIPDFIHAKGNKIVAHKRPCDDILATSHGNYFIEAKFGNNPLLPHQLATQSKVNATNGSYYVLRKKVLNKGTYYTVERYGILFKTQKIEKLFEYFKNPSKGQSIMLEQILPYNTKKLLRKVRV